ncbi:MAG: hypothetical protein WA962_08900 [Ornithinimicrobium sp.]
MSSPESHDQYLQRQAHWHAEDLRRQREARESADLQERARNTRPFSCLTSILGIVLGAIALVALYDAVAANQDTVSSAIDALPASWQESAATSWWIRLLVAALIAAPFILVAHLLKRLRNGLAAVFPAGRVAGTVRWLWLSGVTALRAIFDLIAIPVAFVSYRLLDGSVVQQFADIGTEGIPGALVFIAPAAMLRAVFLGRSLPR